MDLVVEFQEEDDKPMGGRRAKIEKEKKRKLKPGSFGQSPELCSGPHAMISEPCVLLMIVLGHKEKFGAILRMEMQKHWG